MNRRNFFRGGLMTLGAVALGAALPKPKPQMAKAVSTLKPARAGIYAVNGMAPLAATTSLDNFTWQFVDGSGSPACMPSVRLGNGTVLPSLGLQMPTVSWVGPNRLDPPKGIA